MTLQTSGPLKFSELQTETDGMNIVMPSNTTRVIILN